MRKTLLTLAAAMQAAALWAQEPAGPNIIAEQDPAAARGITAEQDTASAQEPAAAMDTAFVFYPPAKIEGGPEWASLEKGKFYAISPRAEWRGGGPLAQGWYMPEMPRRREYISINKEMDFLTWIEIKEDVADSTAQSENKALIITESVHTVDASGNTLEIIGTLSGKRLRAKSLEMARYQGKAAVYDSLSRDLRLLEAAPKEKHEIMPNR